MTENVTSVVLASTSEYRREALARLGIPFAVASPDVDERACPDESGAELSERLALAKAAAVFALRPDSIVIGSDQVGVCGARLLGKPGTVDAAVAQLMTLSGNTAIFYTSVAVMAPALAEPILSCTPTELTFRPFSAAEAATYVACETPLDCAGSFKSEGLGISLFESIRSDDPTALVGLPLIAVVSALRRCGLNPIAPRP